MKLRLVILPPQLFCITASPYSKQVPKQSACIDLSYLIRIKSNVMTKKSTAIGIAMLMLASLTLFSSCSKTGLQSPDNNNDLNAENLQRPAPKGTEFYALTADGMIVKYSSGNPLSEISSVTISGLQSMEGILAIDFRPATGQLYGVSNQSRLYTINPTTGAASAISMTPFTPAINGTQVGFDFNPTVDRIRLVTNNDQNLRLNPETGTVAAIDGNINPSEATVTAVAYTNSFAGTASTTLYDIDVAGNKLYKQNPPNNGTLELVGSLGIEAVGEAGFDISPDNSVAIAAVYGRGLEDGGGEMSNGNKYRFYYINLATGAATNAGKTDRVITGVAIPTNPVAYAVSNMNQLLIFNPADAGNVITKMITGLQAGEDVLGIDMRPATGQLYALGSTSRIYAINMSSGAATMMGSGPFTPALNGTSFGFDFNPTVDRIRVVSNTGQNLRLHPVTGVVAAVDPSLNPGMPTVDAAGYTNSFAGASTTTLYDIDHTSDMLLMQNPANAGTLVGVGSLGIDINAANGFDIGGTSNKAWGLFTVGSNTSLYSVNLSSGMVTMLSPFAAGVKGFAVGLGF